MAVKRTMYQRKVDVDMLNAVKSVLADISSVSPLSERRGDYGLGESLYKLTQFSEHIFRAVSSPTHPTPICIHLWVCI